MDPDKPIEQGLSSEAVQKRRITSGWNELQNPDRRSTWKLLYNVLAEPMVLLLLSAAGIYLLLGEASDAAVLGFSVFIVVGLTLVQEWRSERALRALRDLGSPRVRTCRDGQWIIIPGRELVPDDLVELAEGDRVPADLSIRSAANLRIDESMLTGESMPVEKSATSATNPAEAIQLFAGTLVVAGHTRATVVSIGAQTSMGRIGRSLGEVQTPPTPLQIEMRRLVVLFGVLSIVASTLLAVLYGLMRGDWMQALLAGVTLAMAVIPEEFPVVLTVFLALGAWRMARQKVLVRRSAAIEALGAVGVLCTDKTGTLTENRMALAELVVDPTENPRVAETALLRQAARASNTATRDPMDRAVLDRAGQNSVPVDANRQPVRTYPLGTMPVFAQVWRSDLDGGTELALKGAPEVVLSLCGPDTGHNVARLAQIQAMAGRGLRVLGVAAATCRADQGLPDRLDALTWQWQGLLGFADPLRADVPAAVAEAQGAGIRVLMLTGDHVDTARAIARQAGLGAEPRIVAGQDLDALSDTELGALLARVDGFARVRPEHKLRIVRALAAAGQVTAMTGDGVNDAPALQAATVGVAMGQRGTEVAREAASIVLLDDDFSSIVRAVRLGRAIYERIVQASGYIVAVHVPIAGLALMPLFVDAPLILLPLHVVFLELIIDPACSIVFEREPVPAHIMSRPPRPPEGRLLRAKTLLSSLAQGVLVLLACVLVHTLAGQAGLLPGEQAGLTFVALVAGNLALIFRFRAGAGTWQAVTTANPALMWVLALTLPGLALVAMNETVATWFGFAPQRLDAFLLALAAPVLVVALLDGILRRTGSKQAFAA